MPCSEGLAFSLIFAGLSQCSSFSFFTKALYYNRLSDKRSFIFASAVNHGEGNILILDHLNINHKAGRHDLLKSFYFDVLGCAVDPRKQVNLDSGAKTVWANVGINQFHLPEAEVAQVFDGSVVLSYDPADISALHQRLSSGDVPAVLSDSHFAWSDGSVGSLRLVCPWGNSFELRPKTERDPRGEQPGPRSLACGMSEVKVYVDPSSDLGGVARFYEQLVGAPVKRLGSGPEEQVSVSCGPYQQLIFCRRPLGQSSTASDYHVSMYLRDLPGAFKRMQAMGLIFVNPRFKRQAFTLAEAEEQCMFRIRDIVDPEKPSAGNILQLEHELRSAIKPDGSPYKSCPLKY